MPKGKILKEITIIGFISETDFDNTLVISTEEDDYLIEPNALGRELANHVDEEVEVTGSVTIDEDGNKVIRVIDYDFFDDERDEEEEDDYYDDDEDDDR